MTTGHGMDRRDFLRAGLAGSVLILAPPATGQAGRNRVVALIADPSESGGRGAASAVGTRRACTAGVGRGRRRRTVRADRAGRHGRPLHRRVRARGTHRRGRARARRPAGASRARGARARAHDRIGPRGDHRLWLRRSRPDLCPARAGRPRALRLVTDRRALECDPHRRAPGQPRAQRHAAVHERAARQALVLQITRCGPPT